MITIDPVPGSPLIGQRVTLSPTTNCKDQGLDGQTGVVISYATHMSPAYPVTAFLVLLDSGQPVTVIEYDIMFTPA